MASVYPKGLVSSIASASQINPIATATKPSQARHAARKACVAVSFPKRVNTSQLGKSSVDSNNAIKIVVNNGASCCSHGANIDAGQVLELAQLSGRGCQSWVRSA